MKLSESIILCPGQGAQRAGMGAAWMRESAIFVQTMQEADDALASDLGFALSDACASGPEDRINRTDVAQPALFAIGVACCRALAGSATDNDAVLPLAAAGLSLGEYTALHLVGAFSFVDGLKLVATRGRLMQEAADGSDGSMVALIGADEPSAQRICDEVAKGDEVLVPANFNAPEQIVLSGSASACARCVEAALAMGLRAAPLSVAGAFHSPLMALAADQLSAALDRVEIMPPRVPVLSNVTGQPHSDEGDDGAIVNSIKCRLAQQLTSPVRWDKCCQWLASNVQGAFHELAPSKVLAGLMRRIDRTMRVKTHDEPENTK